MHKNKNGLCLVMSLFLRIFVVNKAESGKMPFLGLKPLKIQFR